MTLFRIGVIMLMLGCIDAVVGSIICDSSRWINLARRTHRWNIGFRVMVSCGILVVLGAVLASLATIQR